MVKQVNKSYDAIDLAKFIMSIIIIFVHVNPWGNRWNPVVYPLGRWCVPVFFIISSFLFFGKYDKLPDNEKGAYFKKFAKRNLQLYLFWFIVYLPYTIIYRDYFHKGIIYFIGSILVGSSFVGSWYLMALLIDVFLISKLDKKCNNYLLMTIGVILYIVCLGESNYRAVANNIPWLAKIYDANPTHFVNCFTVGFVWVYMGRFIARNKARVLAAPMKKAVLFLIGAVVFYVVEVILNYRAGWFNEKLNDVYIGTLFLAPMVFIFVLKLNISVSNAMNLRNMSTIIYCFHPSFGFGLRDYFIIPRFGQYEMPHSIWAWALTTFLSLLIARLIIKYSSKVKILNYAY